MSAVGIDVDWLLRAACRGHDPEWWTLAATSDPAGRRKQRPRRRDLPAVPGASAVPRLGRRPRRRGAHRCRPARATTAAEATGIDRGEATGIDGGEMSEIDLGAPLPDWEREFLADQQRQAVAAWAVVEAAKAWRARIVDDPNLWADDEDFALIAAVDALAQPAEEVPGVADDREQIVPAAGGWVSPVHSTSADKVRVGLVGETPRDVFAYQLGWADALAEAEGRIDVVYADGTHRYWSTHCRHGNHNACNATELAPGLPRQPAQCKTCAAPCVCGCHGEVARA